MKLSERLNQIIASKSLLKHPFYQAWTEGKLSQDVLRRYAGQYWAQVSTFPRFISSVHSRCPEIEARKVLLENLVDEEIHGVDHPELWMRFAEGLGANRAEVKEQAPLPETAKMVADYFDLAASDWTDGLCALYAYESQVPSVATTKIDGLARWYNISAPRDIAFFSVHIEADVVHSHTSEALLERLCDSEAKRLQALAATSRTLDALYGFLDGVTLPIAA